MGIFKCNFQLDQSHRTYHNESNKLKNYQESERNICTGHFRADRGTLHYHVHVGVKMMVTLEVVALYLCVAVGLDEQMSWRPSSPFGTNNSKTS